VKRTLVVALCALSLVAAACGASGTDEAEENDDNGTETTAASNGDGGAVMFGDLELPCGEGDASVAEGEGPSTDTLLLGVANDRTADIRPGLNKELWDTSVAFADWCNEQGGIQGLEIELVDLDGALLNVEAAMTEACDGVFAMVGGAYAQDQFIFSGTSTSDFHECGLIAIPAFAVSVEFSGANGKVEPIPNPADRVATQWVTDFSEQFPDEAETMVVVRGEAPSFDSVEAQFRAAAEAAGVELAPTVNYPILGADDWGPYADLVIDSGATAAYWIGEPTNAAQISQQLLQKNWGGIMLHQTNAYDEVLFDSGPAAVEGTVVRTGFHPFEERDEWEALDQYFEVMERAPDAKIAALGLQSMSSWLLFAVAADECATLNDGVIDRTCVLEQAAAVDEWTAGGLHIPTDPGSGEAPECGMLIVVNDGEFERLTPEIGGDQDDQAGFHCPEDSVVDTDTSGLAEPNVDPDRPI
jgi:hypothetical protein